MNARWMKALAFLAAAGATAAVMAKSRRDPSWLRVEPTFEDEPVSAPPIPSSAESDLALAAADAAIANGMKRRGARVSATATAPGSNSHNSVARSNAS